MEKDILQLWSMELKIPLEKIGMNDSFFDLGGQSINLTRMIMSINQKYKTRIPLSQFFISPSIKNLCHLISIDSNGTDSNESNLEDEIQRLQKQTQYNNALQDAELDYVIRPIKSSTTSSSNKNILLTGATGFLGIFLLVDLLSLSNAKIYCLVRGRDNAHALSRIIATAKLYGLQEQLALSRIDVIVGDISQKNIGMSLNTYQSMTKIIDTIYHNAAEVHHLFSYDQLYQANVNSTLELIKFACTNKEKTFHYISTLSAVSTFDEEAIAPEAPPAKYPPKNLCGYSLTKWVSERLLLQAYEEGLKISIYRIGNITGEDKNGLCTPNKNHAWLFTKGCLQMQAAPTWECDIEMSPVNIVSKAIITLSKYESSPQQPFHIMNPNQLSNASYYQIIQKLGYPISLYPYSIWSKKFLEKITAANALYPLATLYLSKIPDIRKYSCKYTSEVLSKEQVIFPNNYQHLISVYFDYFKTINFL